MSGRLDWRGPQYRAAFARAVERRSKAAAIYLSAQVRADISQAGTLRLTGGVGRNRRGRFTRLTVYNFTHSAPGNPPYKQKGHLRRSIAWELVGLRARVGTNLRYGRYLETGTRRMKPRPYLTRNLRVHRDTLARLLTARVRPGELPAVKPAAFRSGVLGRGARGY